MEFPRNGAACGGSIKDKRHMTENSRVPLTSVHHIDADGVSVFYRQAGPLAAPVVLLLHGFPTSSFQYRELIPRLADRYRVIAPDLPGFGSLSFHRSVSTNTLLTHWPKRFWPSRMRCT